MGTYSDSNPTPLDNAGWELTFADGFNGNAIDRANWPVVYDGSHYWTGAFAWNADALSVGDGELTISNRNVGGDWIAGGLAAIPGEAGAGNSQTYGRYEFRAKIDEGQGTGTAILLWPSSNDHWPPEVDMLETPDGNRSQAWFTQHWPGPGGNGDDYYASTPIQVDAGEWHTYALDWLPGRLTYYIDGQQVFATTENVPDEPMSFGMQGHVYEDTNAWSGGGPDWSTPWEVNIHVDWVRIYAPTSTDPGGAGWAAPEWESAAEEWWDAPAGGDGAAESHHVSAWGGASTIWDFEVGLDSIAATTAHGYVPWVMETEHDGVWGTEYRYGWNEDVVWLPGVTGAGAGELGAEVHRFSAWDGGATIWDFEVGTDRIEASTADGYEPWVREAWQDGVAGTELVYGGNDDVVWLPGVTGVSVDWLI